MADINVERKGPSVWPWIIGLIVLALLIWLLVEMFGNEAGPVVTDPTADTLTVDIAEPAPAPVTAPIAPPAAPDTQIGATPDTSAPPNDTL